MKQFLKRTIFIILFIMIAAGGWLAYDRYRGKACFGCSGYTGQGG